MLSLLPFVKAARKRTLAATRHADADEAFLSFARLKHRSTRWHASYNTLSINNDIHMMRKDTYIVSENVPEPITGQDEELVIFTARQNGNL